MMANGYFSEFNTPWNLPCRAHIIILTVVVLAVGLYFINSVVLISIDGCQYIEIARSIDNGIANVYNSRQAPGYPFLIYLTQHVCLFLGFNACLEQWILSAQIVSLFSKLIAIIEVYYLGKYCIGSYYGFWGALIVSILPDSVDYGCDALTDWPSIMFMMGGLLLLILAIKNRYTWTFFCAGIITALGYLVRHECCQIILYGSAWVLFLFLKPSSTTTKLTLMKYWGALLAGFSMIAVPYMVSRGYVFPEQDFLKLSLYSQTDADTVRSIPTSCMYIAGLSLHSFLGHETLITNLCEILVYYFMPILATGCYCYFKKKSNDHEGKFLIAIIILINLLILIWQSHRGYFPRRYTLPLICYTAFCIPLGVSVIAWSIRRIKVKALEIDDKKYCCWFLTLLFVGIGVCIIKLVEIAPLRWQKQGYRETAEWLRMNTSPGDIIAVPDIRISFYAERKGKIYSKIPLEQAADYIVKIINDKEKVLEENANYSERYSTQINKKKKDRIVTYGKI